MILLLLIPGGIIGFVARKLLRQYEERDRRAEEKRLARQQKKEEANRRLQQPRSPRQKKSQ